ncbi:MAG: hypothetical protein WED10_13305 [Brumimicrobium sp.]
MLINTDTKKPTTPLFSRVQRISEARDFSLDWVSELSDPGNHVWRLKTSTFPGTLAYISLRYDNNESFVFVNLIERKQWNHVKPFENIGETLMAFACFQSLDAGFDGIVSFHAKSRLIQYYQVHMNAQRIGKSHKMVILERDALSLINNYL